MKSMKSMKNIILATLILPIVIGTASAYASGSKGHPKGPQEGFNIGFERSMMRQLDLTDTQKEQLKSLRKANKSAMKTHYKNNFAARQAQRQALRQKIDQLLLADHFDTAQANSLVAEMSAMKAPRQVAMLEQQYKMLSILTTEQKTKLFELQKERADKRAEKMQRRMANNS